MKPLLLLAITAILATSAEAANRKKQNAMARAQAKKEQQEKAQREHRRNAIEKFLSDRDTNHDGSLSKEEFLTQEKDPVEGAKRFDQFNKNGDRYLTKSEIMEMLHL